MSGFDRSLLENPDRLPEILSSWTLQCLIPKPKDFMECPDLFKPATLVIGDFQITSTNKFRYYVTEPGFDPKYQSLSYCDAYDTRRTAITEALRQYFLTRGGIPLIYQSPIYGELTGYGTLSDDKDVVQLVLLVDDLPESFIVAKELTTEAAGLRISAGELWYLMVCAPKSEVIWKTKPALPSPIPPETEAINEFSQLWQEYME